MATQPLTRRAIGKPRAIAGSYMSASAARCRRKFLRVFPDGFRDQTYIDWERGYKWKAHLEWLEWLGHGKYEQLLQKGKADEIASRALRIEAKTNLLFSFEKMALRDAVRSPEGARLLARGLYDFLYRVQDKERAFDRWREVVAALPRKQTRVLTWPVLTVFGFIAQPEKHIFVKPRVTQLAALHYGFDFQYESRPSWNTYLSMQAFAATVRRDLNDLKPRDMIDLQSFLWVQGSEEYPD